MFESLCKHQVCCRKRDQEKMQKIDKNVKITNIYSFLRKWSLKIWQTRKKSD